MGVIVTYYFFVTNKFIFIRKEICNEVKNE
nr:MAG TPA: hypothetical protein [Caudoviricetes sp.]